MIEKIKNDIRKILLESGVSGPVDLTTPPNPEMGDFSFGCFALAKERKQKPNEIAVSIALKIKNLKLEIFDNVEAVGPYVNFFINPQALANMFFSSVSSLFKPLTIGKGKKYLVEFGCPNPLKTFHLGHLKNLITGESIARILENAGYDIVRVNYQGDVGMHVAKAMWAIEKELTRVRNQKHEPLERRLKLLGELYAQGAKAFEEDEVSKKEIVAMNRRVYQKDQKIQEIYRLTVDWSLEYFDQIYKKLSTKFDRLYMESEVFGPGEQIVKKYLKKGIFKESNGAVIYEGSKHGLHDRVFINSEGLPTYEAKDIGLADAHFKDHKPDRIIHVVGKEQTEYFKVVFKAIGDIWSKREKKEFHLPGGFLQLKEGKMSSRKGNVISGDQLLELVITKVGEIMKERDLPNKENVVPKVAVAAIKHSILKVSVSSDVSFDMKSSISTEGDSGPYLLYIVARINSILKKINKQPHPTSTRKAGLRRVGNIAIALSEKKLLLKLAQFPQVTLSAAETLDPSCITQYLFDLAQTFNAFYQECPVLQEENSQIQEFRLELIQRVSQAMGSGLWLLGIETVDQM